MFPSSAPGRADGDDAVEMLLAGANAVGVGTATFPDPRRRSASLDELVDWCARHDVARVRDLIGALERLAMTAPTPTCAAASRSRSTSATSTTPALAPRRWHRGSGWPRSGSSSTRAAGPEPSPACTTRVSGLRRPQAARHPEHRRRAARVLGRHGAAFSTSTPPVATNVARRARRPSDGARATRGCGSGRIRGDRAHERRGRRRVRRAYCATAIEAGCGGVVCSMHVVAW